MSNSGQKFVARNRAPRVQIEYDVEVYGAEKTVQLPFIMGVMSDLSGKSEEPLPAVTDRKFLKIDVDNFDDRMKSMKPRAAFIVQNTLTGEGNLAVDITFESMDDFSPAAIARKVEPLRKLLEARTQLAHLATYMDGKTGAENLIAKLISDPAALAALSTMPSSGPMETDPKTALAGLRVAAVDLPEADAQEDISNILTSLRELPVMEAAGDKASAETALAGLQAKAEFISDNRANEDNGLNDILKGLQKVASETASTEEAGEIDLSALLGVEAEDDVHPDNSETDENSDLAALSSGNEAETAAPLAEPDEDVDDAPVLLLADNGDEDSDLAALLAEDDDAADEETEKEDTDLAALLADEGDNSGSDENDELADLIAGGGGDDTEDETEEDAELATLLADNDAANSTGDDDELAALFADDDNDSELEALLAEDDDDSDLAADDATDSAEAPAIPSPFGTLSADRREDRDEARAKFRIAILADFSGRASRGEMEIGDSLANRKAIRFDVDNIDDVIARFGTTLILPLGNDGEGIEVKLGSLDDLHPDKLYENVELFEELSSLRQRVERGDAAALAELQTWAEHNGNAPRAPSKRAKGSSVPADRKLSDFQALIGDMQGHQVQACPASEIIGRIVAPFVQAAPDPAQETMLTAIDEALSSAMRTILHHPDFQAVESTWRSLELLARRIETNATLEIVLYDVSAEEWAADLAAQDDLAESGLFRMLAEEPRLNAAQGQLSAVFGLYTLEETPPHAELLARMSKISAWMNAPFVTAMSPLFLDTRKEFRHPLVAEAWNNLRALPEAAYVGLAAPRFLLRLPYGAKTEPVDPFDFEEFTLRSGLTGMLWANPVILSATLMAETVRKSGKKMRLGEVMSLGDIPVHTMVDQYADQVALPCTERLLNTRTTAEVVTRGFIPVLSIKGRNEVRQGSFQALGAGELAGPWSPSSGMVSPASGTDTSLSESASEPSDGIEEATSDSSNDLDLGSEADANSESDIDLDDLLAGFGDDADASEDEEMDPELAALLEDL